MVVDCKGNLLTPCENADEIEEHFQIARSVIHAKLMKKFEACGKARFEFRGDVVKNHTRYELMKEIMRDVMGVSESEILDDEERMKGKYRW